MTKRSHQIASRQAAISRERKRKKKSQSTEKHSASSGAPAPIDVAVNFASASSNIAQTIAHNVSTRSSQSIQLDENRYQYVIRDLRKIAIIAAPLIVILIILAFVL
jgi:hypothetical protein